MKQGDILIKGETRRKVLGVCGEVVFMSRNNDFSIVAGIPYTVQELLEDGWTVEQQPWEPKDEDKAWFINDEGTTVRGDWNSAHTDWTRISNFLGIYPTKAAAEAALVEIRRKLGK